MSDLDMTDAPAFIPVKKNKKRKKAKTVVPNNIIWEEELDSITTLPISAPQKKQKTAKSTMAGIQETPEEKRRRELRSQRFNQDQQQPAHLNSQQILLQQKILEQQKQHQNITNSITDREDNWYGSAVKGTCTDIEKPYFRLTSAVDPKTVRPLIVLRKTYKFLRKRWRKEANYSYICEQFKSMRQDLTVQCIRNDFTVKVYESHARIALEKGDMGEFNQCQTQLKYLYALNIDGSVEEFTAYRLLYFIFSQNQSDINSLLGEIKKENYLEGYVEHALNVRSAIATKNYHRFFKLYLNAPNMGGYLMDKFIERERVQALQILCKGYQMGLPLEFVQQELGFDSFEEVSKFFSRHGLLKISGNLKMISTLNPKDVLPKLAEICKSFSKIDIKGQI